MQLGLLEFIGSYTEWECVETDCGKNSSLDPLSIGEGAER